jgi:hypothetical protein
LACGRAFCGHGVFSDGHTAIVDRHGIGITRHELLSLDAIIIANRSH